MATFDELVASRLQWIREVLQPWCRTATLVELKQAAAEWGDIAGRVDTDATLWTWAWSRFPDVVHDEMTGINETCEVKVTLKDGTVVVGFPDARRSQQGWLLLVGSLPADGKEHGPIRIDDIASVAQTVGINHQPVEKPRN